MGFFIDGSILVALSVPERAKREARWVYIDGRRPGVIHSPIAESVDVEFPRQKELEKAHPLVLAGLLDALPFTGVA